MGTAGSAELVLSVGSSFLGANQRFASHYYIISHGFLHLRIRSYLCIRGVLWDNSVSALLLPRLAFSIDSVSLHCCSRTSSPS